MDQLPGIPLGFGMALAMNEAAVNAYAMMTREQKAAVLNRAHKTQTRQEMQILVDGLATDQVI